MKKLSLVIVTYNSSKHIYDCLDSVFLHNDLGGDLEVIVVDNNSQEQKPMFEGIKTKYGDSVILKDSEKNGGYGYGNNVGIKLATAPIVIVMNPDVRIVQPVFKDILLQMEDSAIGVMGVSFIDGSLPYYVKVEKVNIWNQLIHPLRVKLKCYNEKLMYMSGSFLVFRKVAFEEAGMFDENIFMYTEEPDITNRIQKKGYHAVWRPQLQVKHLAHGRGFNRRTEDMMAQSLKYYAVKYNMNLSYNIRVKIMILRIKRVIARVLNDKFKLELFDQRLDYLRQFLETL